MGELPDKRFSARKAANLCAVEGCPNERGRSYSLCVEHQREKARAAVARLRARRREQHDG